MSSVSGDRQIRSSYRFRPGLDPTQERLRELIFTLTKEYGRYDYRRCEGWDVGKDSMYTLWRHEGLQVPQK